MKNLFTKVIFFALIVSLSGIQLIWAQNVGIGTAAPLEKLHVNGGSIRVSALAGVGTRMVGADANGTLLNIAAGANGQVLTQTVGGPAWQNAGGGWLTTGNAGTLPATNFMGSTDNVDVAFRTFNTETFRMTNAQRVGIGTTTPTVKLEVNSGAGDALFGHSNNVGAYLGYETNFTIGTPPQVLNGAGLFASNPAAGYTSIFGQSTGAATVAALITYSTVWMGSYNYVDNASALYNPITNYSYLNVANATLGGDHRAISGFSDRGTVAGNPGFTIGVEGISNSQTQDAIAIQGLAFTNSTTRAGGYFESYNYAGTSQAYAFVGSTVGLARKITGTNAVSEIIPTPNHGRITMTAPEAPEYWYYDYGSVNLVNGQAHVDIDPIMTDIVIIDANNPVRVFATPVGMLNYNGVTVMNQTSTGFDLVEVNGGSHSGKIDYQLVLRPKTGYGEGRFPQAPGPGGIKASLEPQACKAANQPDINNIFYWPADHIQYGYDPADYTGVGSMVRGGPHHGQYKLGANKYGSVLPAQKPQ